MNSDMSFLRALAFFMNVVCFVFCLSIPYIAAKSTFTPEKVAFFLLDPHPKMPNFPLSRNEAADLAAYIDTMHK